MRDELLAFVRAVQDAEREGGMHSLDTRIVSAEDPNKTDRLSIQFGHGYFDRDKVLVWLNDEHLGEAETEEAVDAYLAGRVPKLIERKGGGG